MQRKLGTAVLSACNILTQKTNTSPSLESNVPGRKIVNGFSIRWNDEFSRKIKGQDVRSGETLGGAVKKAARLTPHRTVILDDKQAVNCEELFYLATALARSLLAIAAPGSVVSFILPNWHEAVVIYAATALAGMVANPILPSLRDGEVEFILRDVNCQILFIPDVYRNWNYSEMVQRISRSAGRKFYTVIVRGSGLEPDSYPEFKHYNEMLVRGSDAGFPHVDPDGVRLIIYTSGTSGQPKGVMHSHNSLNALIAQIQECWNINPGDKFLIPSPISHIGGSIYAFECSIYLGITAVLMERWNAVNAVDIIQKKGITHIAAATPILTQILSAAKEKNVRAETLRVFICGGASVPPSLILEASEYFSHTVFTRVYGSTEVPVTTVGVTDKDHVQFAATTDGKVGFASVILSEETDEIKVLCPQMFVGYTNVYDEENAFDDQGYFRTGDQGCWVEGAYLKVTGRIKDIIIRNGENISPKEIEDMLLTHENIADVTIIGIPDKQTGERGCAVIVPHKYPVPDIKDLSAFLTKCGVAVFKHPEALCITDVLPKSDAGKVLKERIKIDIIQKKINLK